MYDPRVKLHQDDCSDTTPDPIFGCLFESSKNKKKQALKVLVIEQGVEIRQEQLS